MKCVSKSVTFAVMAACLALAVISSSSKEKQMHDKREIHASKAISRASSSMTLDGTLARVTSGSTITHGSWSHIGT